MNNEELMNALGLGNLKAAVDKPTFKVGLAGPSGSGKTYSALSFPNPIVFDYDNGLSAHQGKDIQFFPFHSRQWAKSLGASTLTGNVDDLPITCINRRDLIMKVLDKIEPTLRPDQTIIVDSWSKLQEAFDEATHCQPAFSARGAKDDFSFWKRKIAYSEQVMNRLMSLPCSVVVCFHLYKERDSDGSETGKWLPLMDGKFRDKVASYFDNFFVQHCIPLLDAKGKSNKEKFPVPALLTDRENYVWQVKPNATHDAKCALPGITDPYVKASYDTIKKAFPALV